ncbi:MAG: hypothetical protein JJ863_17670 [Deltaproteobacteria bacterium]|nr:hypothetical protein [Deltaproteobacteria bacterium]
MDDENDQRPDSPLLDMALHVAGEELVVAAGHNSGFRRHEVGQALAWWFASELVRRHPHRLRVFETHPHGYDCLTVCTWEPDQAPDGEWRAIAYLNKTGHIAVSVGGEDAVDLNWPEILAAEQPRDYVRLVEKWARLPSPATTPPTVGSSIASRCIAAFLARTLYLSDRWLVLGGATHAAGDPSVRDQLFEQVPGAAAERRDRDGADFWGLPESRFWFLVDRTHDRVAVAVDQTNGRVWLPGARPESLMELYEAAERSVDRLVSNVFPAAF